MKAVLKITGTSKESRYKQLTLSRTWMLVN